MPFYYLNSDNQPVGPMDLAAIHRLSDLEILEPDVLVCESGCEDWIPLSRKQEQASQPEIPKPPRNPPPAQQPASASLESDKRILPAFILCFLFGYLGIHSFYAGRVRDGFLFLGFLIFGYLGLLILPSGLNEALPLPLVGLVFAWVFSIGDLIRILTRAYEDGSGRKITKWT